MTLDKNSTVYNSIAVGEQFRPSLFPEIDQLNSSALNRWLKKNTKGVDSQSKRNLQKSAKKIATNFSVYGSRDIAVVNPATNTGMLKISLKEPAYER